MFDDLNQVFADNYLHHVTSNNLHHVDRNKALICEVYAISREAADSLLRSDLSASKASKFKTVIYFYMFTTM